MKTFLTTLLLISCCLISQAEESKKLKRIKPKNSEQSSENIKLKEALHLEIGLGEIKKAIKLYEEILQAKGASKNTRAVSQLRLGYCWLNQGDQKKAKLYFQKIIENHNDHRNAFQKALLETKRMQIASEKDRLWNAKKKELYDKAKQLNESKAQSQLANELESAEAMYKHLGKKIVDLKWKKNPPNSMAWLEKNQEPEGYWNTAKHEGSGGDDTNLACTGIALLSFLGAGHTDRAGRYKNVLKNGIPWMLKKQKKDGSWSKSNYVNGICTMTLAEAYGMGIRLGKIHELETKLSKSVEYLLSQQGQAGGFNYSKATKLKAPSDKDNMSVSVWCMMGLKSALVSGVEEHEEKIKLAFKKYLGLMDKAWNTKDNTPTTKGLAWYGAEAALGSGKPGGACQAMAMLIRQYGGWKRSEPWLIKASEHQLTNSPKTYAEMDLYRIYFAQLTLFQLNNRGYKNWTKNVRQLLIKGQIKSGKNKGSWNPQTKGIKMGGRVLSTALAALTLEVYYRHHAVISPSLEKMNE